MRNKVLRNTLLAFIMLGMIALMTSCFFNDDEDGDIPDIDSSMVMMTIDLPSDTDNGVEWELEQSQPLFAHEDSFMADEGAEDGDGEVQSFIFTPTKAGSTTLTFTSTDKKTTYTYECEINEAKDDITIKSSTGVSDGESVQAPEPYVEKD